MGPRFSGKVREEPQRRERKWGDYETKTSAIREPEINELGDEVNGRRCFTNGMARRNRSAR